MRDQEELASLAGDQVDVDVAPTGIRPNRLQRRAKRWSDEEGLPIREKRPTLNSLRRRERDVRIQEGKRPKRGDADCTQSVYDEERESIIHMHPTKGRRPFSPKRLAAQQKLFRLQNPRLFHMGVKPSDDGAQV